VFAYPFSPRLAEWINLREWATRFATSFWMRCQAQATDVQLHIGESILTMAVMDSGFAQKRAPDDEKYTCPIPARFVKALRSPPGKHPNDLAFRTPAPHRFRRAFS
jgi:hypothetical protein